MDEAGSRARAAGRQMASVRGSQATRKSPTRKAPSSGAGAEISRVRWAGVALVLAALSAAMTMAAISPSTPTAERPGSAVVPAASATPVAVLEGPVPAAQPEITGPADGSTTGEWEIAVSVVVPQDELPRKSLALEVRRGDEVLARRERPEAKEITLEGIRLEEGPNALVAFLSGPGGPGPASAPITVVLDRTPPVLEVGSPRENTRTTDGSITVSGTSEVGASIDIRNANKGWSDPNKVGPAGSFQTLVPLVEGRNRIVIRSTDEAGNARKETRVVFQQDGRPVVKLRVPKRVDAGSLPRSINVQVTVSDASGDPLGDAEVAYALTIPGQPSQTSEDITDEDGRATWKVTIPKGSSRDNAIIANVKVTGPDGSRTLSSEIRIS